MTVNEGFLDRGADVHAKDKIGWTPLHLATLSGHIKVSKVRRQSSLFARNGC